MLFKLPTQVSGQVTVDSSVVRVVTEMVLFLFK